MSHLIQEYHSWGYTQKTVIQVSPAAPAHPFIAALFTIAKLWKQPRCPTTDEWIKKMWYLYSMEFYAAMKNEMLSFAGKWMELENIILSGVAWPKRPKIVCSPSYAEIRSRANTTRGLDFEHMIKASAHKGEMRTGKTPKKLASICCP
jgi:hypothetical protein